MKILDGKELADYIKERQAKQVRALRQSKNVLPRLAIVQTIDSPIIDAYVRLKKAYGTDILIDVDIHKIKQSALRETIDELNNDPAVHGIIIQLPLDDPSETDTAVNLVAPEKDVDGLGEHATLTPATAMAIDWLAAGYNVDLSSKRIAIVGKGRLVGAPLLSLWQSAGYNVSAYDRKTVDLPKELRSAEVIVTATGVPGLISSSMVAPGAVVIDAGTAAEHGKIVGDLASDVRQRDDLTITPEKGGVGPLTVTALFDNVIRAAQTVATKKTS
jgi:methylenetetrahydrofolate dehydrogenase (NADP+)/methenyltetrahydrofolate cyclohydrolase